jgi:hypothetical protein
VNSDFVSNESGQQEGSVTTLYGARQTESETAVQDVGREDTEWLRKAEAAGASDELA